MNENERIPLDERIIDWTRDETDACQKGTPGCAIDHDAEDLRALRNHLRLVEGSCEPW